MHERHLTWLSGVRAAKEKTLGVGWGDQQTSLRKMQISFI